MAEPDRLRPPDHRSTSPTTSRTAAAPPSVAVGHPHVTARRGAAREGAKRGGGEGQVGGIGVLGIAYSDPLGEHGDLDALPTGVGAVAALTPRADRKAVSHVRRYFCGSDRSFRVNVRNAERVRTR